MVKLLKSFRPDGTQRAVWSDTVAKSFRQNGVIPERASNVEVIREGGKRGQFHVDFSRLADLTGDDRYRVCLTECFDSYAVAVAAEIAWLERHFVVGDPA